MAKPTHTIVSDRIFDPVNIQPELMSGSVILSASLVELIQ